MKTLKKVFAIFLAVAMVLCLSVTAFAESDGSITITSPTTGQTYTAYKIFDLTYSYSKASYEDGKIYYTYDSATDTYSQYTGEGAPTNDTQLYVMNVTYTATEAQKTFYESQTNNPFAFEKNSVGTYNVSVGKKSDGTSYSDDEVIAFLQSFITTDTDGKVSVNSEFAAVIGTGVTGSTSGNNIVISGLSYGYYLITSTIGTVVTIDSTTPNVTVTDKNGKPDADKDVKEDSTGNYGNSNTAGIGDTVEFRTKVTIPVGTVNLVLHDDMDAGLTLDTTSIKVYSDAELKNELTNENNANYTVKTSGFAEGDTCDFEVAFTSAYLNSLTTPTDVYVYYKATVNSGAAISGDGNENATHVSYGNDSNVTSTPSETKTYVWKFDLHKYANDDTTSYLADAEFVLSYTEGTGDDTETKYATFSEITTTTGEGDDAVTTVVGYKLTGWVDNKDDATHIVTNNSTAINIEGLDADTYALTEVKAPDGYNLLDADVTVVIAEAGTVTIGTDTTVVTEVAVQNQSGTKLPSTGGIGTTIFYVVGSILVIGAAVLLITKKRMNGAKK